MHHRATIQHDGLAGDEAAGIGQEIGNRADKIRRFERTLDGLAAAHLFRCFLVLVAEKFHRRLGVHTAGGNSIDANVVAAKLAGQSTCQADNRRFGCGVVQKQRRAEYTGEGRNIDDRAAIFTHAGDDRLAALPDALDVDRHDCIPLVFRQRIESSRLQAAIERGIIDKAVDGSESLEGGSGHCLYRGRVGDIEIYGDAFAARFHKIKGGRTVRNVGGHHFCAVRCKAFGILLTEAACGPGNDNHFTAKTHDTYAASPRST